MERGKHFCGGSKLLTQEISRTTARLGISAFCFLLWLSKEIGRNAYILGVVALLNRTDKLVRHLLSCATESTLCIRLRLGVTGCVSSACVTMEFSLFAFN